jgi:hypothetical protein
MLFARMLRLMNRLRRERDLARRNADEQRRRKHMAQALLDRERAHTLELEVQLSVVDSLIRRIDIEYGPFSELDAWSEGASPLDDF